MCFSVPHSLEQRQAQRRERRERRLHLRHHHEEHHPFLGGGFPFGAFPVPRPPVLGDLFMPQDLAENQPTDSDPLDGENLEDNYYSEPTPGGGTHVLSSPQGAMEFPPAMEMVNVLFFSCALVFPGFILLHSC